jgi:two-component system, OmpR family, response regulator RegX3
MHYNCLIVDDEIELAKMTCEYFQLFDVTCAFVDDSKACFTFLKNNTVDLLLLDINLQDESGFQLCKKLRIESDIPILFISARQSDDDVLIALNIGGDDYIKKPYSLSVLLAKVKIMLKRMRSIATIEQIKNPIHNLTENLRLDEATMRVYAGEKIVELKAKEFKLLQCLYQHKNTIVTKEKLFDMVWGDTYFSDSTLNVHIRKLREKLEDNPNDPVMIKTIWGTGYMLKLEDE